MKRQAFKKIVYPLAAAILLTIPSFAALIAYNCLITGRVDLLPAPASGWIVTNGISARLEALEYPPGTEALTVILENRSDTSLTYGGGYTFYKWTGLFFRSVTVRGASFNTLGYTLNAHETKTFEIGTSILKAPLSPGLYQIVGGVFYVRGEDGFNRGMLPGYRLEFVVRR